MMEHSNAVRMQTYWKIQKIKLINLENRTPAGKHIKTIQNELCERMWIENAPAERDREQLTWHKRKMRSSKVEFYMCNAITRWDGCIE